MCVGACVCHAENYHFLLLLCALSQWIFRSKESPPCLRSNARKLKVLPLVSVPPRQAHTHTHTQNIPHRSACHWWFRYLPHNLHIFIACVLFTPCPKTLARSRSLCSLDFCLLSSPFSWFLVACFVEFLCFVIFIIIFCVVSFLLSAAGCFHHRVDLIAQRVPFYGHPKGMLWAFYALQADIMMGACHMIPWQRVSFHLIIWKSQIHVATGLQFKLLRFSLNEHSLSLAAKNFVPLFFAQIKASLYIYILSSSVLYGHWRFNQIVC